MTTPVFLTRVVLPNYKSIGVGVPHGKHRSMQLERVAGHPGCFRCVRRSGQNRARSEPSPYALFTLQNL